MKKSIFLSIIALCLISVISIAGYALVLLKQLPTTNITPPSITQNEPSTPTKPTTSTPTSETFKIKKLTTDLKLFASDLGDPMQLSVYYEIGTLANGKYKGYKEIVGILNNAGPGGSSVFAFATKDNVTYVADVDPTLAKLPSDDWRNPMNNFDPKKVTSADYIDPNLPKTISLDSAYSLYRTTIMIDHVDIGKVVDTIYEPILVTNLSHLNLLPSKIDGIKIYGNLADTNMAVQNSLGLVYQYNLAFNKNVVSYAAKTATYDKAMAKYNADMKAGKSNVSYPDNVSTPNLAINTGDLVTTSKIYKKYDIALPQACGFLSVTKLAQNMPDYNLEKIGTVNDVDAFKLKDKNAQWNWDEYDNKVNSNVEDEVFKALNSVSKPDFETYVSKTPLIFFKDYWGRLVVDGEYDYNLMGGCGKPVVYLYPETPTEVSVSFNAPTKLDVAIPSYANGWKVLAKPTGELVDLQTQYTNCSSIDSSRVGSEYAQKACTENKYPYIYWAGQSYLPTYPKQTQGWYVAKTDLATTLNAKLDEIGLSAKEKSDMLEYWLPYLQKQPQNFFRISFVQTKAMNLVVPMTVTPQPKSVYRVFLDWEAYNAKPEGQIQPQKLEHITRDGFTLIEWGGLKK